MLKEEDSTNAGGSSEDEAKTKCVACAKIYNPDEFWICCDHCEKWFHGSCVAMTPEKADEIERYMCPGCSYKSSRNKKKPSYRCD
jgi:hypothetical protein